MNQSPSELNVAVIGVGRMGKLHARTYRRLPHARLAAVVDANADRAAMLAEELGCRAYGGVDQLLNHRPTIDAVSVSVPTSLHLATAAPLLERRIACLIEKPLAPTVTEAKTLVDLADRHGATLQVGHSERFNPAVRAVTALGIQARYVEVDRISPMTFRSLDVGVVMDMMIHDLDIVLTLAGSALERVDATGVSVLSEHEDVANARLLFGSGCVANLTASRLALKSERKLRLFSEQAYVSLDFARRNGVVIRKSENIRVLDQVRRQLASGADLANLDYSDLVHVEQLNMDSPDDDPLRDPLTAQLSSFLDSVRNGDRPAVDGAAGYAAVEAAQRVAEAIRSHHWQGLSGGRV